MALPFSTARALVDPAHPRTLATPNTRALNGPIRWSADFTGYPAGALVTLPSGLILTRSTIATVQTGTSTMVSGVAINSARIGRKLDADVLGLVIEETRTNYVINNRNLTGGGWSVGGGSETVTVDQGAGPDGTAAIADRMQVASGSYGHNQVLVDAAIVAPAIAKFTASLWMRATSGTTTQAWYGQSTGAGADLQGVYTASLSTAWQRQSVAVTAGVSASIIEVCDGRAVFGGEVAGARDVLLDLSQIEPGKFATEAIITSGVALARADDRMRHPRAKQLLGNDGFGGMYFRLRPKGGVDDYETSVYLWHDDGNHYSFIKSGVGNDHKIYVGTNTGASIVSSGALTWVAGDVLDVWTEITESLIKTAWRVNGGAATKFTAVSYARPAMPAGNVYCLPGQAFFGTVLFSSIVEKIQSYEPNYRPAWAE